MINIRICIFLEGVYVVYTDWKTWDTNTDSDGLPRDWVVKNPPAIAGDVDSIPGSGDPLEKEVAAHSSILAAKSHGQRGLVGYSPWGQKRVSYDLVIKQCKQLIQTLETWAKSNYFESLFYNS